MRILGLRAAGFLAGASATCLSLTAGAQTPARDFSTYQPVAEAVRIEVSEAPKIDGRLDDAAWAKAKLISEFYQHDPNMGAPPSFKTEARILFDQDTIYVAFRAYDPEPAKIMRTVMNRDGDVSKDDVVRIYFDPQDTKRNGYAFEVSASGARREALLENNTTFISEWDTIWHAHTAVDDQGWTAEIAIPVRSFSFNPSADSWGVNLGRTIKRLNEPVRWSVISRSIWFGDMSKSGRLKGISGISQGLGLDIQTYAGARYKYEWANPRQGDLTLEPSGSLFYKITPSLTGTLTFNTDFSDTPLDQRQVQTGRFGLFFPETRDFFLQDASIFEFGGRGLQETPNGRPFFSRNIGITDFGIVDIVAGGKISGSVAGLNVAGLGVRTAGRTGVAEKTLGAVRLSAPVLGESQIGAIYTYGDPSNDVDNQVGGFDFQYRNSNLFAGRNFQADFYWERSITDGLDDDAFGFEIASYNDDLSLWVNGKQIGRDFDPGLGFVNRTDFRRVYGGARKRWRPKDSWLLFWQVESGGEVVWTLDNHLDTREMWVSGGLVTREGDEAFFNVNNTRENITTGFFLPDGVFVPAGIYDYSRVNLFLGASSTREVFGFFEVNYGELWGGPYLSLAGRIEWRPSPYFSIAVRHNMQNFDLPGGRLTVHVDSAIATLNFTPDMSLIFQSEYDNISSEVGLSARYRWEFQPGAELFASVGHSSYWEGHEFRSNQSVGVLRVGNTFRF